MFSNFMLQKDVSWIEVEKHLERETQWLYNSLSFYGNTARHELKEVHTNYGYCRHCILRKIAMLISAGNVKAREIKKEAGLPSFWRTESPNIEGDNDDRTVFHGKEWHSRKMQAIEKHFIMEGCDVIREPITPWGRADLGVYKEKYKDLIVEVGTISVLKLFINLKKSKDSIFLIVPDDEKLIEFVV